MLSLLASSVLALDLAKGQTFEFLLTIEREKPKASGAIRSKVIVKSTRDGIITLTDEIIGLSMNGKDRLAELKSSIPEPIVTFDWNRNAQRSGAMSPFAVRKSIPADLLGVLGEAGLYLCEFPGRALKYNDTWAGSTTATGGCTGGKYVYKGLRPTKMGQVADIEVLNIAMSASEQIGPMKMEVDTRTGIPVTVEYKVKGRKSGQISQFRQTWIR